jgi:hypothetical protein
MNIPGFDKAQANHDVSEPIEKEDKIENFLDRQTDHAQVRLFAEFIISKEINPFDEPERMIPSLLVERFNNWIYENYIGG